jgi:uncharacterized membrane protein YhaH (DUF805 family)
MNWYLEGLKNYATFSGRARRKEFWLFVLLNFIISVILIGVDLSTGTFSEKTGVGLLGGVYAWAVVLPSLALTVRRLHDTDRSAWWLLILLIPFIGAITLLVYSAQDSMPGQNQYGANPKEEMA